MGGASSRFGSNKARSLFDTKPLYRLLYERLTLRFGVVSCIVKADNSPLEPDTLSYPDLIPGLGPLGGILTALHYSTCTSCFITAVDHPFLPLELPTLLAPQLADADVVVPLWKGRPQPLTAFYRRSCLPAVRATLERGERRVRAFWDQVRVAEVDIENYLAPEQAETAFFNINCNEDYIRAQALLQELTATRGTGTND